MKRILLALAILSTCLTGAVGAGTPPQFNFNPQDVAKYDAVVVTVCGLRLAQLKAIVLHDFFRRDASGTAAGAPESDAFQVDASTEPGDSYLENTLTGMLAAAGKHYLVVPLPWNRDPDQSVAAEAQIQAWLPQVYAAAKANNKPLYAFTHSWGTMLMHEALTALATQGSPVHIDKLITTGSPLVPSSRLVHHFDVMELPAQDFGTLTVKPANVTAWTNFWAKRDIISGVIPAADLNYRVDGGADYDASLLEQACKDPLHIVAALKDLKTLRAIHLWHFSYLKGYHELFPAIHTQLDLDIPDTEIMPNAF